MKSDEENPLWERSLGEGIWRICDLWNLSTTFWAENWTIHYSLVWWSKLFRTILKLLLPKISDNWTLQNFPTLDQINLHECLLHTIPKMKKLKHIAYLYYKKNKELKQKTWKSVKDSATFIEVKSIKMKIFNDFNEKKNAVSWSWRL